MVSEKELDTHRREAISYKFTELMRTELSLIGAETGRAVNYLTDATGPLDMLHCIEERCLVIRQYYAEYLKSVYRPLEASNVELELQAMIAGREVVARPKGGD
jgi:hypothetical protein